MDGNANNSCDIPDYEKCPLGGDVTNNCADCFYAGDYHYVDGDCVRRPD